MRSKKEYDIGNLELAVSIKDYAVHFRRLAINHLRNENGIVAEGFRETYRNVFNRSYESFLKKQAENGVWGTYIELSALAELTGTKVVVTSKDHGNETTWVLYEPHDEEPHSTFYIHCHENKHFTYRGIEVEGDYYPSHERTPGDGNCLYNAFSQAAKVYSQIKQAPENIIVDPENAPEFPESDFYLESQKLELERYNKESGRCAPSIDVPYKPEEMMDRLMAIELALKEENKVSSFFFRNKSEPSNHSAARQSNCSSEAMEKNSEISQAEDTRMLVF